MTFVKLTAEDLKRRELEEKIRSGEIDVENLTPEQKKLREGGRK